MQHGLVLMDVHVVGVQAGVDLLHYRLEHDVGKGVVSMGWRGQVNRWDSYQQASIDTVSKLPP